MTESGYKYDKVVERKLGVRLPVLNGRTITKDTILRDALILPGDRAKAKLRKKGLEDVRMPPASHGAHMSVGRHVLLPQAGKRKGTKSVRDLLAELLRKREFILYFDSAPQSGGPTRCAIYPPIKKAEIGRIFARAGYDTKLSGASHDEIMLGAFSVLTNTSKMGCWSFNLPVGPPSQGGTCPASDLGFQFLTIGEIEKRQKAKRDPSIVIDPANFVCNGCYAAKGNYGNPTMIVIMQARLMLANALLANSERRRGPVKPPKYAPAPLTPNIRMDVPKTLSIIRPEDFASARRGIPVTARSRITKIIKRARARKVIEPLTDSFDEVMYAAIENARVFVAARRAGKLKMADVEKASSRALKKMYEEAAVILSDYGEREPGKAMLRVKYDWQLPDPNYFRIHDAGDFYNDLYFNEWLNVMEHYARNDPSLRFWAPVRVWAYKGILTDRSLKRVPENFALRPSTLHFRDKAPSRKKIHEDLGLPRFKRRKGGGLSAPSGAAAKSYIPTTGKNWTCPAYEHVSNKGGALFKSPTGAGVGGTCAIARGPAGEPSCRVCWNGYAGEYADHVVWYQEH